MLEKKIFYRDNNSLLVYSDTFKFMENMKHNSIDMIFADPPYFLSNGGFSNSGGKKVSVNKGEWDKINTLEEKHAFNKKWISLAKQILKPNGTIWITGTYHNIYSVGMALEEDGFKILNNITWQKRNPAPNLSCRVFTHSTETLLWAKNKTGKNRHYFNYDLLKQINNGKQMTDVWDGPLTPHKEKRFGKHPTQKPEYLLERVILASTKPTDFILDPFVGSGTTGVIAKRLNRRFIGIDNNEYYLDIAKKRLINEISLIEKNKKR